ncbi:MAG TPA: hypothetical protein VG168_13565 [Bryobacteraceae bacterium]|nr:hypothetical protein [Bryobacteraceae bacterium]
MPNYLQPGSDGTLPANGPDWRKGLVYTARPSIPSPLVSNHEYRIKFVFKRRITEGQEFTEYEELYGRITRLAEVRISQLRCAETAASLHTWIVSQGWMSMSGPYNFATAFLTTGLLSTNSSDEVPKGQEPPTPADLLLPSTTPHEAALRSENPPPNEIYNEFDFSDPSTSNSDPIVLSYGERVAGLEGIDFEPFVNSAAGLATTYSDFLSNESSMPRNKFEIIGREWYSVTSPDLAVVHVYWAAEPIDLRTMKRVRCTSQTPF